MFIITDSSTQSINSPCLKSDDNMMRGSNEACEPISAVAVAVFLLILVDLKRCKEGNC